MFVFMNPKNFNVFVHILENFLLLCVYKCGFLWLEISLLKGHTCTRAFYTVCSSTVLKLILTGIANAVNNDCPDWFQNVARVENLCMEARGRVCSVSAGLRLLDHARHLPATDQALPHGHLWPVRGSLVCRPAQHDHEEGRQGTEHDHEKRR